MKIVYLFLVGVLLLHSDFVISQSTTPMYLPTNAGEMKKELTDLKSLFLIQISKCMASSTANKDIYQCIHGYDGNPKTAYIAKAGKGQSWVGFFKGPSTVYQVRVLNTSTCCPERLAGTEVYIGTQKCGKIPTGTKSTTWYTVTCPSPMQDSYVKLVSTRNTYLSFSGIEVYGTSDHSNAEQQPALPEPKPEKLLKMTKCAQSGTYNSSYPCQHGYDGNDKTSQITKAGVGQWWQGFFSGEKTVNKVMVRNRADCCGERLTGTEVYVGTKLCGKITGTTVTAKWYTVTCSEPVKGSFVKLVTTTPTWLQTSGMKVYGTD